jgi:hypothetical protein
MFVHRQRGSPAIAQTVAGRDPERNKESEVPSRDVVGREEVCPGVALDVTAEAELDEHRLSDPVCIRLTPV